MPGAVLAADGTVTVTGSIKGGSVGAGITFATLPAGMRPALQEEFVVAISSGTAKIIIFQTVQFKVSQRLMQQGPR